MNGSHSQYELGGIVKSVYSQRAQYDHTMRPWMIGSSIVRGGAYFYRMTFSYQRSSMMMCEVNSHSYSVFYLGFIPSSSIQASNFLFLLPFILHITNPCAGSWSLYSTLLIPVWGRGVYTPHY